jgi:hypothetical protein
MRLQLLSLLGLVNSLDTLGALFREDLVTKQVKAYYYLWLCNPDDFGTSACFGGELADGSRANCSGAFWSGYTQPTA